MKPQRILTAGHSAVEPTAIRLALPTTLLLKPWA